MRILVFLLAFTAWSGSVHAAEPAPVAPALDRPDPSRQLLDRWYVGDLNGQPALSLHLVATPTPEGRTTVQEMTLVINRTLNGRPLRFEIRSRQELHEDRQGRVVSFVLDQDENGSRTSATGRVEGRTVLAETSRLGRTAPQRLDIPVGCELLSAQAAQEALAALPADAPPLRFAAIELAEARVVVSTSRAQGRGRDADGNGLFSVTSDLVPVPIALALDHRGILVSMNLHLGPFAIAIRRSDGPVAILGGEVDAARLVKASGPPPHGDGPLRYRLSATAPVQLGAFQHRVDDAVIEVVAQADGETLADPAPFLAATSQLELDDPQLKAWALAAIAGKESAAERAETLRLAVRTHITTKDLSNGDASALEAWRTRRGDCSEHANLLAAALRIAGLPARVEIGVIWVDEFGAWCGHAWVSAYFAGRWNHLDASYPGVSRNRYLAIDAGGAPTTATALVATLAALGADGITVLP